MHNFAIVLEGHNITRCKAAILLFDSEAYRSFNMIFTSSEEKSINNAMTACVLSPIYGH